VYIHETIINVVTGALEAFVIHNAATRESTSALLAKDLGVSKPTVLKALSHLRFWKVKPSYKQGLTYTM
jgi:Mn-dependent DtxR family transcriptional regulator